MRGDATRLPFAPDAMDAVVIVWLPHLLPDPAPVPAEAARVPRPGGVLITTVDKDDAYVVEDSDIARATAASRRRYAPRVPDRVSRVLGRTAEPGPGFAGRTAFPGTGQGRSPLRWREVIEEGRIPWATHARPRTG